MRGVSDGLSLLSTSAKPKLDKLNQGDGLD
jgi:hypothetical protein